MKNNLKQILSVVISFTLAFFIRRYLRLPANEAIWLIITMAIYFLFSKRVYINDLKENIWLLFFSAIFSLANIAGYHIVLNGDYYSGLFTDNFITIYSISDFIGFIGLVIFFWIMFGYAGKILDDLSDKANISVVYKYKEINLKYFLLTMAFIVMAWFPYFLVYYPGFIFPDSMSSIWQSLGVWGLNNHHPIMYTFFIKLCLNIGMMLNDITLGCALYTVIQMLYIAAALSYMICWLKCKGISTQICIMIMASYSFIPFIAQNSIAMWKDPIFSAAILIWSLLLLEYVISKGRIVLSDKWFMVKNGVTVLIICFSRNNGFYIILFCEIIFICLFFILKRKNTVEGLKKISVCTGLWLIVVYIITGPGYSFLGIEKEPVESLGIFLNQMARVAVYGGEMSEKDYEFLNNLMPIEKYKDNYCPCVVDKLKWSDDFNGEYLKTHLSDFARTYISLLVKNPKIYVEAWELNTFGYWAPNRWEYYSDADNIQKGSIPEFGESGITPKNLLGNINIDWNSIVKNSGTALYLAAINWLVLGAGIIICMKKKWIYLAAIAPTLGLLFSLLIATPYVYWQRYGLAEYYLLPVYIFIVFAVVKEAKVTSEIDEIK